MKILILSLVSIILITNCLHVSGQVVNDTVQKDYLMEGQKHDEWNKIHDYWFKNHFYNCLGKFKLKMSCSRCEDIFIDVVMEIDSLGKLAKYSVVKEDVCGHPAKKEFIDCMIKYFREMQFPDCLKNSVFETRLGTGLKC